MSEATISFDAARVELLLNELRLPGVKAIWPKIAAQSDKEGWSAARFLAALVEREATDRTRRRIERNMAEARLPVGKTLAAFEFESTPMISKAQVMALAAGDVWLRPGPISFSSARPAAEKSSGGGNWPRPRRERMSRPVPAHQQACPAIADWAWCKGQRYGTIICDLERGRVL